MKRSYIKYFSAICLLSFSGAAWAQVSKDDKKQEPARATMTEEIEVVRPYKPILAEAVKIRRSPDLNTNKPFKPVLTYTILDKKLELNSNIKELQAQKLAEEQAPTLQDNYLKIGAGNLNTGFGELYLNTGKDEAMQAGMYVKHLSQQGSLNKQQFSHQQIAAFGRSIGNQVTLAGKLGYDRRSTYFYGFNPVLPPSAADPDKQRFNLLEAEGELMSNYSANTNKFNYAFKANGYLFSNIFDGRENSISISGHLAQAFGEFQLGVNASTDFTSSKDSLYVIGNHIFRANPHVKYQGTGFTLNLGLNVVQEFGKTSRLNILPAVSAEFPIAEEYATFFAGLNGDVLKTSLRDLTNDNPYLNKNVELKNSIEKMNFYGGIKGNAGAGLGYKVMAYYKTIQDLPLFVNDPFKINRFNIIYDNGQSKLLGFEGEITVKASDVLNLSGKAEAINYDMASEKAAWFKPGFKLSANARAAISPKISLDAAILYGGASKAKTFNTLQEMQVVTLKSYADFSAGAEYRLNNKLGIYLRANNILGNSYQQYLYYSKLGLNVVGGFNFSF
ncbi:MAG TPA: TonB-dependent receptor [Daejeonella sp.]|nr:TonB-dependent receptor [Daejeonella sp.]